MSLLIQYIITMKAEVKPIPSIFLESAEHFHAVKKQNQPLTKAGVGPRSLLTPYGAN